jgi:ribosomal protein S18 acetylase RimI-like enzyme
MWDSGDRSWAADPQADLYKPKFQEKWFERLLEASSEYSAEAFFIREQDRLVSFVSYYAYQDLNEQEIQYSSYKNGTPSVWIQMVAVDPAYQGCGYGAMALELVESLSRSKGAECIRLMTQSSNKVAQEFYLRLGYRFSGNDGLRDPSRHYYNVFFEKSLV